MVKWLDTTSRIKSIRTVEIDSNEVLNSQWTEDTLKAPVTKDGVSTEVSLKPLIAPLGNYGKVLIESKNLDVLRDSLKNYWQITGKPRILSQVLETEAEPIHLRNKIISKTRLKESASPDVNKLIADINKNFEYNRVVVGGDDTNVELQFLNSNFRKAVKVNDPVDAGLFLSINGQVKIAPGIHQLRCTNGMTERMDIYDGSEFRSGDDYIKRATDLATWFGTQADKPVHNTREISVRLQGYPESFLKRFYKGWSERIALKELTWFDIVYEVTQSVNNTLSPLRYKVLEVAQPLRQYEKEPCRCKTCSASVEEEK